jgi:C-terminal processing protease CtpA/Prc
LYDFVSGEETALTTGEGSDVTPRFSPDGKKVAYVRDGHELHVRDVASGDDRVVASAQLWDAPFTSPEPLVWSPDGRWLAYFATDAHMFTNVWVVPADGGADPRPASGLADSFASTLAWSKDGRTIYFDTQQRTEDGRIARVDLMPRTPTFREDRFDSLFVEKKPSEGDAAEAGGEAADPTTTVDFQDIGRRLTLLPTGVDVGTLALSPDGKTLVFTASAEGQQNLYAYSVDPEADEPPVTRQLTSTPGSKSTPRFTPDGKEVFFLDRGRIQAVDVASGKTRSVSVTAQLDVDFDAEKVEVFDEGWTYLRDNFYDDQYHGADWQEVRRRFEPRIRGARTRAEESRLMNLMVGELNGSHLGHSIQGRSGPSSGLLGVRFDRGTYESSGKLKVTEVLHLGPAHVSGIEAGDFVLAVDGTPITARTNLDRLLQNKVGDRVTVRVADDASGSGARDVEVKPISSGQERQLAYRDWVEANRAYVDSVSGGRLGYVHMRDMGWGSYEQLIQDLDAANFGKDGVVIDIRNNHGGFVNAYALDVFARQGYLTLQVRGYPETAARSLLGQRALQKPTVLVVNQHTLSDGEDFTEGYRTLDLGRVVGVHTAGWIIYTWGARLVDGSSLRMPRSKVRGHDGQVMERNPRPVDVEVVRPMGESYAGRDSQLDAAVRTLLGALR